MHPDLIIKTNPIVFLRRLLLIELLFGLATLLLTFTIDFEALYNQLQLQRWASLNMVLSLGVTLLQVLVITIAFLTWYFDSYKITREAVIHRRGNWLGQIQLAQTQAITAITVHQPQLGETFNYGNLILTTLNHDKKRVLRNIPNPEFYLVEIKKRLAPSRESINAELQKSITEMIALGEGQYVEFKSSLSWDYRQQRINKDLYKAVMKNLIAFMNTTGGAVLMGVDDEGEILGLEVEFAAARKGNIDGFENTFNMAFNTMIGVDFRQYVRFDYEVFDGKTVARAIAFPAPEPVFLTHKNKEEFYIRTGNSSQPMTMRQAVKYILTHFSH